MTGLRSVLLAEDDERDVFLLQRAFRDAKIGHPLFNVPDGQDAIDYLSGAGKFNDRVKHPVPHLLVLDLKMPRKTGMDVLLWLRATPPLRCLPVVILTSSAHPADVQAAYENGANAFIVKPNGTQRRLELVRALIDFWLGLNEPPAIAGQPFSLS